MKNFHKMVPPPSSICEILIQIFQPQRASSQGINQSWRAQAQKSSAPPTAPLWSWSPWANASRPLDRRPVCRGDGRPFQCSGGSLDPWQAGWAGSVRPRGREAQAGGHLWGCNRSMKVLGDVIVVFPRRMILTFPPELSISAPVGRWRQNSFLAFVVVWPVKEDNLSGLNEW